MSLVAIKIFKPIELGPQFGRGTGLLRVVIGQVLELYKGNQF